MRTAGPPAHAAATSPLLIDDAGEPRRVAATPTLGTVEVPADVEALRRPILLALGAGDWPSAPCLLTRCRPRRRRQRRSLRRRAEHRARRDESVTAERGLFDAPPHGAQTGSRLSAGSRGAACVATADRTTPRHDEGDMSELSEVLSPDSPRAVRSPRRIESARPRICHTASESVTSLLRSGRVAAAAAAAARAEARGESTDREAAGEARRRLGAARADWALADLCLARGLTVTARRVLERLASTATDVRGPDGLTAKQAVASFALLAVSSPREREPRITAHAVERWRERVDPTANRRSAERALREAVRGENILERRKDGTLRFVPASRPHVCVLARREGRLVTVLTVLSLDARGPR
jgi:hypothetical protein